MALNNEVPLIPAVQRALAIPEILNHIFECLYHYRPATCSWGGRSILSCALVNKLWFSEAIRWLWQDPRPPLHREGSHDDFVVVLGKIPEARRNLYARYIKRATLLYYKRKPDGPDGVQFPSLRCVHIWGPIDLSDLEEIKFRNNCVRSIWYFIRCPSDTEIEEHATASFEKLLTPLLSHFNHLREWVIFSGRSMDTTQYFKFTPGTEGQGWHRSEHGRVRVPPNQGV
ncbi:hypothetical protein BO85DRAFT_304323 [Aspergillus piperis CBS 112811]|uniref:F-box domain-containing protein n=1 Tax=Aspergillus piperis CBS 112811 TaxID=1448313 RepID=A0A8G1VMG4_9EURO|nr:hypothetical protein BO85DRAFT_304323 [Aspergillus piperis CBS 112811]RAH57502.1 hypothetical protein BO85DRAFT_304323 [Aspergillus piperis CBS 112811]